MGLASDNVNFRMDYEVARQLADIAHALSPVIKNRSQALRISIAVCHAVMFEPKKLSGLVTKLQVLVRTLDRSSAALAKGSNDSPVAKRLRLAAETKALYGKK